MSTRKGPFTLNFCINVCINVCMCLWLRKRKSRQECKLLHRLTALVALSGPSFRRLIHRTNRCDHLLLESPGRTLLSHGRWSGPYFRCLIHRINRIDHRLLESPVWALLSHVSWSGPSFWRLIHRTNRLGHRLPNHWSNPYSIKVQSGPSFRRLILDVTSRRRINLCSFITDRTGESALDVSVSVSIRSGSVNHSIIGRQL